jgi:hypothetical protein
VIFVRVVAILIVDSEFWLALPVDVGSRWPNHVKYCYLVWMFYVFVRVRVNAFPLALNHNNYEYVTKLFIYVSF